MKTVGIDAVTITPGKGGSGGGVWSYTKSILLSMDQILEKDSSMRVKVFVNKDFNIQLNHIETIQVKEETESILTRFKYIHYTLPRLCKQHEIDVLHKLATEVPILYRGKLLVTIHDLVLDFYLKKKYHGYKLAELTKLYYFRFIEKVAIKKAKIIFTNSVSLKSELLQKNSRANVLVTGSGNLITPKELIVRSKKNPLQIYCIAGFYPHKGHAHVIRLMEALFLNYHIDAVLHFRGNPSDSKYFSSVKKMIEQSPYHARILIDDFVKEFSLEEIYSNASFMILLSEYEGFGLPIIEAQALGIPVICSDIPVFRDISGGFACFVQLEDITYSAKTVQDFFNDEETQKINIKNGFENVKRFQWNKIAEQIFEAYKSVAD